MAGIDVSGISGSDVCCAFIGMPSCSCCGSFVFWFSSKAAACDSKLGKRLVSTDSGQHRERIEDYGQPWVLNLIYSLKTSIDFNSGEPPALPTPATV